MDRIGCDCCSRRVMHPLRCTACLLPGTYPGVTFDSAGVCIYCRAARPATNRSAELDLFVQEAREWDGPAQVIVPYSGGKDSAYALHVLTRRFGLRALAISFDNCFRTPLAQANIDALASEPGVSLVSLKPEWHLMRDIYAAFLRDPGEFCSACNAVGYLVLLSQIVVLQRRLGRRVPVVGAWSSRLEAMPGMYSFTMRYFDEVLAGAGLVDRLLAHPLVERSCYDYLLSRGDPRAGSEGADAPVRYLMLPEYLPWVQAEITRTLTAETGWRAPADATHFDCWAYPVARYLEQRKYGFSQSVVTTAALVRDGQISREEASARLAREPAGRPSEFGPFLSRLGVKESEVNWDGRWYPQRASAD